MENQQTKKQKFLIPTKSICKRETTTQLVDFPYIFFVSAQKALSLLCIILYFFVNCEELI